jgi:hypothetical protein
VGRRTEDDEIGGNSALDRKRRVGTLEGKREGKGASEKSGHKEGQIGKLPSGRWSSDKLDTSRKQHTWHIYRIRGTPAQFLGSVTAPNEKRALEEAAKEFNITNPEQQKRLMAVRED